VPPVSDGSLTRRELVKAGAATAAAGALAGATPAEAKKKRRRRRRRKARKVDVVVVGAGIAGLQAARELVHAGKSVRVLEARKRVGGRVLNHRLASGDVADMGGTFAGPTQDHILALAKDMKVGTFPTYNTGNNVYWNGRSRSTFPADGPTGNAPTDPALVPDIAQAVLKLDEMSKQVPVDAPWTAGNAAEWDAITLHSWIRDNGINKQGLLDITTAATEAIFGGGPGDLSFLYTLFYIAASGNEKNPGTFERNFNTKDGAQEQRFHGGAALIPQRMAKQLGRGRIRLNTPVRKIVQNARGARVYSDKKSFRCRQVIVAMPPALAGRIRYGPKVPALRDQLTQRVPQGTLIKFDAVYDRAFWRDKGLTGQAVSLQGPVKVTFDASPPDGKPGVLLGFIGGHEARVWQRRSKAERQAAALECFARYFGAEARSPRQVVEINWASELWSGGCPVALFQPGTLYDFGEALRAPHGRIHWAGTETSTYWNGYMDGAVRSGERAAKEVLAKL
jgi:monoamine oxidase